MGTKQNAAVEDGGESGQLVDQLLYGDMGTSSKTIVAVLTDHIRKDDRTRFDIPRDPSDFERCRQLLMVMPQWRERLPEVARIFPKWAPMVREWDRMEALFLEERPSGRAPKLYKLMKALEQEGNRFEKGGVVYEGDWRIDIDAHAAVHGPADLRTAFEYDEEKRRWRGHLDGNWRAKDGGISMRDFAKVLMAADRVFNRVMNQHGRGPEVSVKPMTNEAPSP